ncbi:MAG: UPF0280 family protein [Methanobacteriaceae archaeon]|nr:UPF0280 family protein [Methanobacteriaceae archaeon]
MYNENLMIKETNISLTTDLKDHNLNDYLLSIRGDLIEYINYNSLFLSSLKPLNNISYDVKPIIRLMNDASNIANVGPMASVAGAISEVSCNYLINLGSHYSIVNNGGDISLINNKKVTCGIFSENDYLKNSFGFKLKTRKTPIGICTSSSKTGLSLSFGESESVTVVSKKASYADSLATSIANHVKGFENEEAIQNALEIAENFKEYFDGVLIIKEGNVGTLGKLPKIVSTKPFDIDY